MAEARWNVRVMAGGPAVAEELRWAGGAEADARALAAKAAGEAVVLEEVESGQAGLLAEAVRAAGGDAAFSPGPTARVVLAGTRAVFDALGPALERGTGDLKEIGRAIAQARQASRRDRFQIALPGGRRLDLGPRPALMGIVNVTPDSFSGDGLAGDPEAAVARAVRHVEAGADLLDVGGESTRPGSDPVAPGEELRRVVPVIERLAGRVGVPISIDTRRGRVAREALAAGAAIINDVTGLQGDPDVAAAAAERGAAVIVMHMLGEPKTMQREPRYDNVLADVCRHLRRGLDRARQAGIPGERSIVDPGIGFGKTLDHNLAILARLGEVRSLGRPVLVGVSRKRFIGDLTGVERPADRAFGTAAACALAVAAGALLLRVHDVAEMRQAAAVAAAIAEKGRPLP